MKTITTKCEIDFKDQVVEVEFIGIVNEVDNGIGRYEYHGSIGFDSQPGLEVEEIEWDKTTYNDEQNSIIESYLNDNEDSIMDALCERYQTEYPEDYDEYEDD